MGLMTQKNNLGPLTQNPYNVWDLCPAPVIIRLLRSYIYIGYRYITCIILSRA